MITPLGCEASLIALARTKATDGERRGEGAPAFRVCPGNANQATVPRDLTDELLLRSFNWARWQLGIPLPVEE